MSPEEIEALLADRDALRDWKDEVQPVLAALADVIDDDGLEAVKRVVPAKGSAWGWLHERARS